MLRMVVDERLGNTSELLGMSAELGQEPAISATSQLARYGETMTRSVVLWLVQLQVSSERVSSYRSGGDARERLLNRLFRVPGLPASGEPMVSSPAIGRA